MDLHEKALEALLRPAGSGLYLVSTGRALVEAFQARFYGAQKEEEVLEAHRSALRRVGKARIAMIGLPSDAGAGFRRGANLGPLGLREALLEMPDWQDFVEAHGIVDVGDIFVVPQFLSEAMLSDAQQEASRRALYGDPLAPWPVAPLEMAEVVIRALLEINPTLRILALGGDHSLSWPVVSTLIPRHNSIGILHIDAHTDLLSERLGVRICFATWAYHANELLGRGGRLVQVGIRASRYAREHWEKTLGVRQMWAKEFLADPQKGIETLIAWLKEAGIKRLYISNDIDGTDALWADATGTPEPHGLWPEHVEALIRHAGEAFEIVGGDLVEVAPPLSASKTTTETGARYLRAMLEVMARC
ncbi:MAG: arginase family protein [Sandaracinaceae bacterium]|nr:arginase family protein [Sandaracinaceae bacterium]